MRNKGVSASGGLVEYWCGNYPPLSCVHNEAKETGILNSPHCSVLTLTKEARIQTGLSHFYWAVKLMVLDFMWFVLCMCVGGVWVCPSQPAPYGYLGGSSEMWEVEIVYSYTYSGMTNTDQHQGIHWNSTREILSFQYPLTERLQSNEGAIHVTCVYWNILIVSWAEPYKLNTETVTFRIKWIKVSLFKYYNLNYYSFVSQL